MDTTTLIHRVAVPYSMGDRMIEVYGDPEMGWYEWRVLDGQRTEKDTGTEGIGKSRGRMYGSPEIALRDALMVTSGMDDPGLLRER